MASQYPAKIDSVVSLPTAVDNLTPVTGAVANRLRDAILRIQNELGVKPSGVYGTVRSRLDALEAATFGLGGGGALIVGGAPQIGQTVIWDGAGWLPSTNFVTQSIQTTGGITSGPINSTQLNTGLIQLTGKLIMNGVSTSILSASGQGIIYFDSVSNQFLVSQNGGAYAPLGSGGGGGGFLAGGDLSGSSTSQNVIKIQNHPISNTAPTTNQALIYNGTAWAPSNLASSLPPNGAAGGDLSGTYPNPIVAALQGHALSSTAPSDGYVLTYVTGANQWKSNFISDGNVSTSAGIAGTKIVPNFGTQNVITQGFLSLGASPATIGFIRLPQVGSIYQNDNGNDRIVWSGAFNSQSFGDILSPTVTLQGTVTNVNASSTIDLQINSTNVFTLTSNNTVSSNNFTAPSYIFSGSGGPSITTGTGAPSLIENNGSLYLRQDGTASSGLYLYEAGSWTAIGSPTGAAGGDLSGTYPNPTVVNINGTLVPASPTAGRVLVATSTVTAAWNLLLDANISPAAAIAGSKVVPSFGAQVISTTNQVNGGFATFTGLSVTTTGLNVGTLSTGIAHVNGLGAFSSSLIVDSDVSSSAGIAGTKISPNFGSQNILTTGTDTAASFIFGSGPSITSGTGVPSSTPSNGSLFLRQDGSSSTGLYTYQAGAWSAIGGGGGGSSLPTAPGSGFSLISTGPSTETWALIVDGYVSATAAIAGTKISPNFGSQNITTTGALNTGSATVTSLSSSFVDVAGKIASEAITTSVLSNTAQGIIYFDSVTNRYLVSENGGPYVALVRAGHALVKSAAYTVLTTDSDVFCNVSSAAFTITLPATPFLGEVHTFKDHTGSAATHNLTIAGNGKVIEQFSGTGTASTLVLNQNYDSVTLEYNGTNWSIV